MEYISLLEDGCYLHEKEWNCHLFLVNHFASGCATLQLVAGKEVSLNHSQQVIHHCIMPPVTPKVLPTVQHIVGLVEGYSQFNVLLQALPPPWQILMHIYILYVAVQLMHIDMHVHSVSLSCICACRKVEEDIFI